MRVTELIWLSPTECESMHEALGAALSRWSKGWGLDFVSQGHKPERAGAADPCAWEGSAREAVAAALFGACWRASELARKCSTEAVSQWREILVREFGWDASAHEPGSSLWTVEAQLCGQGMSWSFSAQQVRAWTRAKRPTEARPMARVDVVERLSPLPAMVQVEWQPTRVSAAALLGLSVGDVIRLAHPLARPLVLRMPGECPLAHAYLGQRQGRLVAQVVVGARDDGAAEDSEGLVMKEMMVEKLEFTEVGERAMDAPKIPTRLEALGAVQAEVTVSAGTARASVQQLLALTEGDLLTLDRALTEPFDVVLNGAVIAKGELVAVGEHYGLKVVQVAPRGQS